MKIVKNDYPFKVIIEDKKSKAGKEYQAISIRQRILTSLTSVIYLNCQV